MGEVRGPHGETPPGPGWWMANDYCWYPPEARPGELWEAPPSLRGIPADVAGSGSASSDRDLRADVLCSGERADRSTPTADATWRPTRERKDEAALLTALGLMLIILGVVLLAGVRLQWPDASALVRLLAWVPVAAGSSLTLIGSMRYLGSPS